MNHFGTASLITRNTNDIQQIQLFLQMALTMMVIAPIMCVGGIFMAIHEGAQLSTLLLVAVPVMGVFIGVVMIRVIPAVPFDAVQDRPHQPGAARTDHRRARDSRLRPQ